MDDIKSAADFVAERKLKTLTELTQDQAIAVKDLLHSSLDSLLDKTKAMELHKAVGVHWDILKETYADHNEYASEVIGRTIKSFTELTIQDSIDLREHFKDGFYYPDFNPEIADNY